MKKQNASKKESSKFKKFLKIYVVILLILMALFLGYVANSLIKYENNQNDVYMANLIEKLKKESKKGKIEKMVDFSDLQISEFENEKTTISQGLNYILENNNITYKLNEESTEENLVYNIYANDRLILEVRLNGSKKENRLGLLTFIDWKIDSIKNKAENGLYICDILVPSNYSVLVNDKQIGEAQIKQNSEESGLSQISKYIDIPHDVTYQIPQLLKQPSIKILDENNNEVQYENKDNVFTVQLEFKKISDKQEALKEIKNPPKIMKIAEDWSLFLTNDLTGRLHGFYNINKYLIKDSDIYKYAYNWATGVDITFVSKHSLMYPTFSKESISNFEIYNENAFSCEVYLQKNLRLITGKRIEDKMHERMYFAYYDDTDDNKDNPTWKLVNMQSIVDTNN